MAASEASSFLAAAKAGDTETLSKLITSDPSLLQYRGAGTPDATSGNSAVHWAAAKSQSKALALLLAARGDPHARNNGDSTPLSTAVMAGSAECISLLLTAGADPSLADEFGDTPISLATRAKRDDLVALLGRSAGDATAPASTPATPTPTPAVSTAENKMAGNAAFARKDYEEAIEWYGKALASVSQILTGEGDTPPSEAAEAIETAAALFSNRSASYAALQMFDLALDDAERAVQLRPKWAKAHSRVGAARHGKKELQPALEAYQLALTYEPGNEGAQAQMKAIKLALRNQRLEELFEKGAFNKREAAGQGEAGPSGVGSGEAGAGDAGPGDAGGGGSTGGEDGAGGGGGESGGAAAGGGAPLKPSTTVKPARTPEQVAYAQSVAAWMGAAKRGDVTMMATLLDKEEWLLSNRSENTAESLLGNSALHWASAFGRLEVVEWLLAREGIQVSKRNHGGGTPLHSAASHNRAEVVAALLEAGADVAAKDENGDTPRDAAMRRGYRVSEAWLDRGPLAAKARWPCGESGGGAIGSGNAPRPESSAAAKSAGNAAFAGTHLLGPRHAVWHYTDAILLHREEQGGGAATVDVSDGDATTQREPTAAESAEAVLLSNRSAAHAKLYQYHAALDDAESAVKLRPRWGKAHGRVGAAFLGLGDLGAAEAAYREGLRHEPSEQLDKGLEEVLNRKEQKEKAAAAAGPSLGSVSSAA